MFSTHDNFIEQSVLILEQLVTNKKLLDWMGEGSTVVHLLNRTLILYYIFASQQKVPLFIQQL